MFIIFLTLAFIAFMVCLTVAPGPGRPLRQVRAVAVLWFGVLAPVVVFLFSAVLAPDYRKGDTADWLHCFHLGKLALMPLVLYGGAALYRFETMPREHAIARWVARGLLLGATTALATLVLGLKGALNEEFADFRPLLLVPVYVVLWYAVRCVQALLHTTLDGAFWTPVVIGAIPFWVSSIYWTNRILAQLPDDQPKCFVVSAASHGHAAVVGPFVDIDGCAGRRVNLQLLTLWRFETMWMARAPRTHAAFRKIYDRCGPVIAARMGNKYLADLVFLALKPAEWLARLFLRSAA